MRNHLTPTQSNILLALAKYKFLTVSQFLELGISTQKTNLSSSLKPLKLSRKPLVKYDQFGVHPKLGRLEDVYYLHKNAVKLLVEQLHIDEEDIKIPKGRGVQFSQDYFHRKSTIECQISLEKATQASELEIDFFDRYFDKTGSSRRGGLNVKTKLLLDDDNFIIADAIFLLKGSGINNLYCLEMYNGKDTKRTLKQLLKHLKALELGSPSTKYNHKKGNRVLSVFEFPSMMTSVIERLNENPLFLNFNDYFLFKSLDDVKEDFFSEWKTMQSKSLVY